MVIELDGLKQAFYPDYHKVKLWNQNPVLWKQLLTEAYSIAKEFPVVTGYWPGECFPPDNTLVCVIEESRLDYKGEDRSERALYIPVWKNQIRDLYRMSSGSSTRIIYFCDSNGLLRFLRKEIDRSGFILKPLSLGYHQSADVQIGFVTKPTYDLRTTIGTGRDFRLLDGTPWMPNCCSLCGHHVPVDQAQFVGGDLVHNNKSICLALVRKSGHKYTTGDYRNGNVRRKQY
jgi:hypothetical protein